MTVHANIQILLKCVKGFGVGTVKLPYTMLEGHGQIVLFVSLTELEVS